MFEPHLTSAHLQMLQRIADTMTRVNMAYLAQVVSFYLAAKPRCGIKHWLQHSLRSSTHRLAVDGLHELIARLSDEDLIVLCQRMGQHAQHECEPPG